MIEAPLADAQLLVVDDQQANVVLLRRMLELAGFTRVLTTTDPRQVEQITLQHELDLLVLDLNMPAMDGFAVMEMLSRVHARDVPPILVLTAQADVESRVRALQSGARDYVTKPFDRVEVLTRLRNLLETRMAYKQLRSANRDLDAQVRARTEEIVATRLEIIRRLGRAAEFRDNETGLHIIRMSKTTALLGAELGLPEERCELLLHASPMHDIGKIGIPDRILLKPGKLDPEEWVVMKSHAAIGAEILSGADSELLRTARDIALTHHEKWDGSGYPSGLAGEQIPLAGRLVAAADVFDALTSERPYKKAWPLDAAVEYMREQSGKHFDPQVITAFMTRLDSILDIRERYREPDASM